jgi:hypothetical protein
MANWYQRKPSDDAKLIMLLRLGRVDVAIAALEAAKAVCEADGDVVPEAVIPFVDELKAFGLMPSADDCLHFLRMKRKHRGTTRYHVAPGGTTENHVAPDKIRKDKIGEEKKKRAPRVPKPSEDGWAPKQDHIDIAKERGLDLNAEVTAMLDWLKASGKTYKDYDAFARNWLRRANPRPAQVKRPNLSNNLLQTNDHPEGAGEEYWLAGINKYGGNHG